MEVENNANVNANVNVDANTNVTTNETENPTINASDFEKFTLGIAFLATVFTILGVYVYKGVVDSNLVYLVTIEVSAFVARKGLKYHYQYGTNVADAESPVASSKRKIINQK